MLLPLLLLLLVTAPDARALSLKTDSELELGAERRHPLLRMGEAAARQFGELLATKNFSVVIHMRQAEGTRAALLAVYEATDRRLFELDVDGVDHQLVVYAKTVANTVDRITVDRDLADARWHRLIVEMSGDDLKIVVDCESVLSGKYPQIDLRHGGDGAPSVFVGQRPDGSARFVGSLKEFTADSDHLTERYCPTTTTSTTAATTTMNSLARILVPTELTEPKTEVHQAVQYLNHRVGYLENQFKEWRTLVKSYETRLKHVQLHQRGCQIGTLVLDDGDKWADDANCTTCVCHRGEAICHPTGCPELECASPMAVVDRCCPTCGRRCYYSGKYFEHGSTSWPKECVRCDCSDGEMSCKFVRASECPTAPCESARQHTPANECCPVCGDADHCALRPCGTNASCVNTRHSRNCRCEQGFFGDGERCYDVDECLWDADARRQLGGCGAGTRCINTRGAFRCECMPGFDRLDHLTCLDTVLL